MSDLRKHNADSTDPKLFSLKHWCRDRDLSVSTFRKLMKEDKAPKITKIDGVNKLFITKLDSDEWDKRLHG